MKINIFQRIIKDEILKLYLKDNSAKWYFNKLFYHIEITPKFSLWILRNDFSYHNKYFMFNLIHITKFRHFIKFHHEYSKTLENFRFNVFEYIENTIIAEIKNLLLK